MKKQNIIIKTPTVSLQGTLKVPPEPESIVLFANGCGCGRHSKRNQYIANILNSAHIATLLFDLLTVEEEPEIANRFNIPLLTERLLLATEWSWENSEIATLPMGYFGASTGAAAALNAAAELGNNIKAVVSRGGRPDLALPVLPKVEAATLLIVGSEDDVIVSLNETAYEKLSSIKKLALIPKATHLFEEPGTLEEVARQACKWFEKYLKIDDLL